MKKCFCAYLTAWRVTEITIQLSKGSSGIMENWWPWLNILFLRRLTSRPMVVSLN